MQNTNAQTLQVVERKLIVPEHTARERETEAKREDVDYRTTFHGVRELGGYI